MNHVQRIEYMQALVKAYRLIVNVRDEPLETSDTLRTLWEDAAMKMAAYASPHESAWIERQAALVESNVWK